VLYLALASLSSLPPWQEERALFARERAAGVYSSHAYLATTVAFDLLTMRVLPTLFLATIGYSMMGLRGGLGPRVRYWAAITLCNVASASASMAIGAAASSTSVANVLASLCVLANLLFSGFLLSLHSLPRAVAALSRLSYARCALAIISLLSTRCRSGVRRCCAAEHEFREFSDSASVHASSECAMTRLGVACRYAYEVLVVNEFDGAGVFQLTPFMPPGTPPESIPHKDVTGTDVLKIFYVNTSAVSADLLCLILIAIGYITLTALLLHLRQ
jgi:hypothetical protein